MRKRTNSRSRRVEAAVGNALVSPQVERESGTQYASENGQWFAHVSECDDHCRITLTRKRCTGPVLPLVEAPAYVRVLLKSKEGTDDSHRVDHNPPSLASIGDLPTKMPLYWYADLSSVALPDQALWMYELRSTKPKDGRDVSWTEGTWDDWKQSVIKYAPGALVDEIVSRQKRKVGVK